MSEVNPEDDLLQVLSVDGRQYQFYDVTRLGEPYQKLPYCLRIILECLVRKGEQAADCQEVWQDSAAKILAFRDHEADDILFHPGRVLLQDFTGVPALIDLAALRDVVVEKGGNPDVVDSLCPADLVVDHTVQLDYSQVLASAKAKQKVRLPTAEDQLLLQPADQPQPTIIVHSTFPPPAPGAYFNNPYTLFAPHPPIYSVPPTFYSVSRYQPFYSPTPAAIASHGEDCGIPSDNPGLPIQDEVCPFHQRLSYWSELLQKKKEQEFQQNSERFGFLKWVNKVFKNITVIPPGTGIMHQVNLEYLARVVTCQEELLFPDSLIGTDSHTTMINGLGVLGWCVGTMDAESVMFGHPISMPIPKVIGCRISGVIPPFATSTEIVLLVTKKLRHTGVSGCFVEFCGPGIAELSVADRATIANMCPEYGALIGFFPADEETLHYLEQTGRDGQKVRCIREYLSRVKMLREEDSPEANYSSVIEINLSDVQPCVSGPKRSKDKVTVKSISSDFKNALVSNGETAKGFGLSPEQVHATFSVNIDGFLHTITHGSVLLAAITSCSNTSNPSVMLGAGLLAKKAIEAGLSVAKYVKTSLSPGSGVVTSYLHESGVMPYLYMLGFEVVGYGCSTCVDNSRPLPQSIVDAIKQGNLVCCGVLSGNRNFEGRIQSDIKANYLASPMLVIAYAIAGKIDIDFDNEPLGYDAADKPVFLADIWPSRQEIQEFEKRFVIPAIFRQVYARISYGTKHWSVIKTPEENVYPWDAKSTFIQSPLYIQEICKELPSSPQESLLGMRCLLKLGDNITSDHISPAGSIVRNSPAAEYLASLGLVPRDYNSYGSRRGNCQVMMRGTFAHIRLQNQLSQKLGPYTTHFPSGVPTTVFDAAQRYKEEKVPLFVVAGENFGRGAARDWATKGPLLLGVRAILAVSFDPTYRANLVKTGILPVQIDKTTYEILTGREKVDVLLPDLDGKNKKLHVSLSLNKEFDLKAGLRLDNSYEVGLFKEGGVMKQLLKRSLKCRETS